MFNHGLLQFLEKESEKYLQEIGKKFNPNYSILFWNDQESLKKGIAFYEKALTLVDIQDNSAIKHIDTVTIKPGKEAGNQATHPRYGCSWLTQQKYK